MKKTVLSVIVAIVIIVAVVVGAYFILNGSEEEKTIDLNTASQTLSNSSPFNELSTMDITIDVLSSVYGINKDMTKAIYWLKKAAENGSKEPSGMLEQFMAALKEAANSGNKDAIQIWKEIEPYYQ